MIEGERRGHLAAHGMPDHDHRAPGPAFEKVAQASAVGGEIVRRVGLVAEAEAGQVHGNDLVPPGQGVEDRPVTHQRFAIAMQKKQGGVTPSGAKDTKPDVAGLEPLGLVKGGRRRVGPDIPPQPEQDPEHQEPGHDPPHRRLSKGVMGE